MALRELVQVGEEEEAIVSKAPLCVMHFET